VAGRWAGLASTCELREAKQTVCRQ
jgi:hypothetical protein